MEGINQYATLAENRKSLKVSMEARDFVYM